MVRFVTAVGRDANARMVARNKHYVVFDRPEDKGRELKSAQPSIGWAEDTEGYPTLPYSVAALLLLRLACEPKDRGAALHTDWERKSGRHRLGTPVPERP